MNQVDGLSSVGRELFLKSLISSNVPIYLSIKKEGQAFLDKKSSVELKSGDLLFEKSRIQFPKTKQILGLLQKGNQWRIFFYLNKAGYFFDSSIRLNLGYIETSVPSVIRKMESGSSSHSIFSGELAFAVDGKNVSIPLRINEGYDVVHVREFDMEKSSTAMGRPGLGERKSLYEFLGNICVYLSDSFENDSAATAGLMLPLDLIFVDRDYLVYGERTASGMFLDGQVYSVVLCFAVSPIIKRSIRCRCTVERIFAGKGDRNCYVCRITECREEDRRFLSEEIARFI